MSTLSLRLPESIHRHIKEIEKRAKKENFRKILAKVPNRKPRDGDEI